MSKLRDLIAESRRAVIFTGAGISTESGIPDFRSPGGIWSKMKPIYYDEFVGSEEKRRESWTRTFSGVMRWTGATPNPGHYAVARLVANRMSQNLKVPIIVDNKAGAGQLIGINAVKGKQPDGRLLLFIAGSAIAQAPAIRPAETTYNPLKDFSLIAMTAVSPGVVAASNKLPANNLREFVAYAKANPGKLNFGSAGAGNAGHLQMEYFMKQTGTQLVHIPYKSDNQQALELVEGRLDVSIITLAAAAPLAKDGRIKILATTSVEPVPFIAGIPSLRQSGVPGLEGMDPFTFFGIVGPAGMSPELIRQFNEAHNQVLRNPEVVATLRNAMSSEPISRTPDEFRKFIEQELAKWGEIGKNIKLD